MNSANYITVLLIIYIVFVQSQCMPEVFKRIKEKADFQILCSMTLRSNNSFSMINNSELENVEQVQVQTSKEYSLSTLEREQEIECIQRYYKELNYYSAKDHSTSSVMGTREKELHFDIARRNGVEKPAKRKAKDSTKVYGNEKGINLTSNISKVIPAGREIQNIFEKCCLVSDRPICITKDNSTSYLTNDDIPTLLPLGDQVSQMSHTLTPGTHFLHQMCDKLGSAICLASLECEEEDIKRNCSILEPCILDVSYRLHACIDGFLYESSWNEPEVVIICAFFPYNVWVEKDLVEKIIKATFMVPVSLIAAVANGIVIYVIMRHRHLHKPINILVGNMALAQILLAAICPYFFLISDFNQNYAFDYAGCKTQGFLELLLMMVSEYSLLCICTQRLVIVTSRQFLGEKNTSRRKRPKLKGAFTICFCIWFLAATVASPVAVNRFFAKRRWLNYEETFCSEWEWMTRLYWPSLAFVLIYFPLLTLIGAYMVIFFKVSGYRKPIHY
ncbi:hypothetical protein SK128_003737 [Halocaridina rubra]|uniref:G-protein coupled receptors family 1 profile domain-containing protein n=1 Tax=Halocaridina rubra TaxID=373956 RepID=A0AAN8ZY49_HALRR